MKKYRFLLITLGILAAALWWPLRGDCELSPNQSFTTVGTISDGSGGSRLWGSGTRLAQ